MIDNEKVVISGLNKKFPNGFKAVDRLSIDILKGEIMILLGHNGAGKTTTL